MNKPPVPKPPTAAEALARKKAAKRTNRTDVAGRSGMGESSSSNVSYKASNRNGENKAALKTGQLASQNAGGSSWDSTGAGIDSVVTAHKYAYDRKESMNPRRDNSGYGNAGFGKNK